MQCPRDADAEGVKRESVRVYMYVFLAKDVGQQNK